MRLLHAGEEDPPLRPTLCFSVLFPECILTMKRKLPPFSKRLRSPITSKTFNEKGETLKEELQGKLEKAAQAWSGTTLDVAVGEDLTIVAPITVTSDGFFSSTSPQFTLTGDVETAQEIDANYSETLLKYYSSRQDQLLTYGVLLVGLDEQGQELVSQRVGSVQLAWVNDHVAIPAKTKVSFDNKLSFNDGAAEAYTKVKSLMLKVDSK